VFLKSKKLREVFLKHKRNITKKPETKQLEADLYGWHNHHPFVRGGRWVSPSHFREGHTGWMIQRCQGGGSTPCSPRGGPNLCIHGICGGSGSPTHTPAVEKYFFVFFCVLWLFGKVLAVEGLESVIATDKCLAVKYYLIQVDGVGSGNCWKSYIAWVLKICAIYKGEGKPQLLS
jgi:hypothetical protein